MRLHLHASLLRMLGRLERDGWAYVNLPAVDAQGKALLPARYPLAQLEKIRDTIGPYGWASLYQGQPYARGGTLFQDVYQFDELPAGAPMVHSLFPLLWSAAGV